MNIAGPVKDGPLIRRAFEEGMRLLEESGEAGTEEAAREACERGNECGYRVAQVRGALGVKIR